jgi:uncharacterized protein (TIGR03435 family)
MPNASSTAQLALNLTSRLDRPVVDKTGLMASYAYSVTWSLEDVFTAVQEQFALKLKPQKASMDTLVIDRAEAPSTN